MTSIRLTRRETLAALAASGSMFAFPGLAQAPSAPASALLDDAAWRLLAFDPEQATSLGVDKGEHAGLRGQLRDRSPAGVARIAETLRGDLALVEKVDARSLDAATRTSLDVVKSAYRLALDGFALPYGDVAIGGWRNTPYVVIQNVGAYLDIPRFLDSDHPVRDKADADAYLSRLAAMGAQLDGETERMRAAAAKGMIPPAFLLEKTARQLRQTVAGAAEGGDLVTSLVRRTHDISGDWERQARTVVTGAVLKALERQLAEVEALRGKATMDAGIWARPDGDAWYAWGLRAATTTNRSPDDVHETGKRELAALHARMDPILASLGYTKGTVGERMAGLGKNPRFRFPEGDPGRAEVIAAMRGKIDFIRTRLPQAFRRLAPGNLEIRRLPLAEEEGAPNAYGGAGSIDGSTPGRIWLNLGDTARHTRYSVATLAFHEGIPGHVWQGEYANQLPLIRSILSFNAYSEGWALYAEQLGDELGAYEGDPVGRLGYLQSLAFRACRLVVDTGMHAKRWTRDQALQWFATANGSPIPELAPEIDRYCSWPGQACGYKLGHTEIVRQRDKAKKALGKHFDLRDFDQAVVEGGNVPLDVLGGNVDRYIAEVKRG